ncbi:unnamed protein product [Leptidea sinapis]|uniref:MADF domain-containing protein n=1 Tax=Leptidea sinapis TaxID=189913 RepID=A0A5E4QFK2_9NEOP|nr:unnamed protein product [Leptidea sinapis]
MRPGYMCSRRLNSLPEVKLKWKKLRDSYRDALKRQNACCQLLRAGSPPVGRMADARRKWSHLRNSYSRHLRNELQGACTSKGRMVSKWYLADELDFLREHMATDT